MRKKIAILMILVMMMLVGCGSEYRYAGKWESPFDLTFEDGTPIEMEEDAELNIILEECKDMILETDMKVKYPYFNWEALEEVEICRSKGGVKLKTGETKVDYIDAKYFVKLNKVLVFPVCSEYEEDYFKTLVLHELMHTLTYSEEAAKYQIWEGIADFLAGQISSLNNLPFRFQYQYEVLYLSHFFAVFGESETQKLLYYGELDKKIDELTEEGMAKKFHDALAILSSFYEIYGTSDTEELEELVRVIQDVLCHMTANYCKEMKEMDEETSNSILESCKGMLIIEDGYFKQLLR